MVEMQLTVRVSDSGILCCYDNLMTLIKQKKIKHV